MSTIGQRLKDVRNKLGYNQGDFGNLFDMTAAAISEIERDKNSPNIAILKKLAEMKIDLKWLLLGTGEMFENDLKKEKLSIQDIIPLLEDIAKLLDDEGKKRILEMLNQD